MRFTSTVGAYHLAKNLELSRLPLEVLLPLFPFRMGHGKIPYHLHYFLFLGPFLME